MPGCANRRRDWEKIFRPRDVVAGSQKVQNPEHLIDWREACPTCWNACRLKDRQHLTRLWWTKTYEEPTLSDEEEEEEEGVANVSRVPHPTPLITPLITPRT